MTYKNKVTAQILGGESIDGDIRRFNLNDLLSIAKEADAEIEILNIQIDELLKLCQHPYSGSVGWGCLECNFDQKHKIHQVN
jgi:hypothetical protein